MRGWEKNKVFFGSVGRCLKMCCLQYAAVVAREARFKRKILAKSRRKRRKFQMLTQDSSSVDIPYTFHPANAAAAVRESSRLIYDQGRI